MNLLTLEFRRKDFCNQNRKAHMIGDLRIPEVTSYHGKDRA